MKWVYNDGGRAMAGYKGSARDCVTRAVAIYTGMPYEEARKLVNKHAKGSPRVVSGQLRRSSASRGVGKAALTAIMQELGLEWTPLMRVGSKSRVHMRADEVPEGRFIARMSGHVAVVDSGVVLDTHDPCRGGERTVYGYWR